MQFTGYFQVCWSHLPQSDGDCIKIGIEERSAYVSRVTFVTCARESVKTLTPADTAKLARGVPQIVRE